jgi:RNA polymerase sigma factor (sigma-70 family)
MAFGRLTRKLLCDKDVASHFFTKYGVAESSVREVMTQLHDYVKKIYIPEHCSVDHDGLLAVAVESVIRTCQNYSKDREGTFVGYCVTRSKGAILDEMRKTHILHTRHAQGCPAVVSTSDTLFGDEESVDTIEDSLIGDVGDIDRSIVSDELNKFVAQEIALLPKKQREWACLYFWHGMFLAEIGRMYDRSESAVYVALKKISERMAVRYNNA